jgi:hypothetical protein
MISMLSGGAPPRRKHTNDAQPFALAHVKADGYLIRSEDVARLSAHSFNYNVPDVLIQGELQPLRDPV